MRFDLKIYVIKTKMDFVSISATLSFEYKIENSLMKFTGGLFDGKKIRMNKEYVSVYDIIQVAGGQKNQKSVWERLMKIHQEDVVSKCDYLKFNGPGQKWKIK